MIEIQIRGRIPVRDQKGVPGRTEGESEVTSKAQ